MTTTFDKKAADLARTVIHTEIWGERERQKEREMGCWFDDSQRFYNPHIDSDIDEFTSLSRCLFTFFPALSLSLFVFNSHVIMVCSVCNAVCPFKLHANANTLTNLSNSMHFTLNFQSINFTQQHFIFLRTVFRCIPLFIRNRFFSLSFLCPALAVSLCCGFICVQLCNYGVSVCLCVHVSSY